MDNIIVFEKARKQGRKPLNLSDEERMARNEALREARKARLLASVPGTLAELPESYPLPFDMLLPVAGLPFSRAWVYQLMKERRFPSSVKLSDNRIAWLAGDIRRYMAERTNGAAYKVVTL